MGEVVELAMFRHKHSGKEKQRRRRSSGGVSALRGRCGHPIKDFEEGNCMGCMVEEFRAQASELAKVIRLSCPQCLDSRGGSCNEHLYLAEA